MAKFYVELQCWEHWPKALVMCRNRNDGTVERRLYVPEWPDGVWVKEKKCKVVSAYDLDFYGDWESRVYALSCGHEFKWDDTEPPAYCPECGAKVMSE